MSTSTVVEHPRPETPPEPPRPLARRPWRRIDSDRVLAIGVVISAALHFLLFLVFSHVFLVPTPSLAPNRPIAQRTRPPGMEVFNIAPTQSAAPVEQAVPRRQPRRRQTPAQPPTQAAPSQPAGATAPEALLSPTERLRPRMGDVHIWAPVVVPTLPERALNIEDVRARIAAELRLLNDSAAAAAAEAARGTNWTVTDKNGNVWGITPGKLHLGKITLPLPFSLPPPTGDMGKQAEEWKEIRGQGAREAARENFKDRVKAIRERKEKEHEEKLKKEKETKPTPPPSSGKPPP